MDCYGGLATMSGCRRDILKHPAVVSGSPTSTLLQGTLLLIIFVGALPTIKTEDLRLKIMRGLHMTRTPQLSQIQSNISQTEFETKHNEYFYRMEQNQKRTTHSVFNYGDENIVRKKLFKFTHSGMEILRKQNYETKLNMNYSVYIPEESNCSIEIAETSLRLLVVPKICAKNRQRINLKVIKNGWLQIHEETFETHECLSNWVGIDLTEGVRLGLRSNFELSVECDKCGEKNIELTSPYLNVIVNVKNRSRRRRAEYTGNRDGLNCNKTPLHVNFSEIPGYKYIMQPKSINIGLCIGRCPHRWRMSQHAILQHVVSFSNSTVPKPCCSPSQMKGLEYLYLSQEDYSTLKIGFWKDSIVVDCRCS